MLRAWIGLCAAALVSSGCQFGSATAETRHENQSVDLDTSAKVHVAIRMGAGELNVKSGTPKLLDADFAYNAPARKPIVEYHTGPSGGELSVTQPSDTGSSSGGTVYTWDLKLNSEVPLEVDVNVGAGEANLELGQTNLQRVTVNVGAGELKLDLRGDPRRDFSVDVHGGVGEATVYLPKNAAISATASGGLGEINATGLEKRNGTWVNPEAAAASPTVRVNVTGGVGEIHLVR